MERFFCLIYHNEDWLVEKVMEYVEKFSYEKYILHLNEEDCRLSISNLSSLFIKVLKENSLTLDYVSYDNYSEDSAVTFGKLKAQKYLQHGTNFSMVLGLIKLYRQSYIELIMQAEFERKHERCCQMLINRLFDRIEFGICIGWNDSQEELITTNKYLEQWVLELQTSREELALENHHLKNIIEFLPDATFVLDKNKKVIVWNKAMEELTGVNKAEIIGKGDYTYAVPFYGKPEPILIDLLTSNKQHEFEKYDLVKREGDELYAENFVPALNNGQGAYLRGKASLLYDSLGNYNGAIQSIRDITDRKKAETALKREKEQLAVTLASIGDAVIAVDLDGCVTLLNSVAESLTRYNHAEAIEQPLSKIFNIINEYTKEPVEYPVNKVLREGKIDVLVNNIALIAKDGTERSIANSAAPIIDASGNILGAILVFRNVTKGRQREEALRKSEERFRFLSENARDIIYRIQIYPKPKIEYVSPAVARITGYKPEEFYQEPGILYQIIHPDERGVLDNLYAGKYELEMLFITQWVHRDGHIIWTEHNNTPIYDENGKLIAIEGIVRDITERKRAEETIINSRDFYLTLFNDFPTMIWHSGTDAKFNYFNKSWLNFTGRTMEQKMGYRWTEGIHPDDYNLWLKNYLKAFNSRRSFKTVYRLRRHDGEYRWITDIARPFNDLEGNFAGYIGSCYDITEPKKTAEVLKRYQLLFKNTRDIILFVRQDGRIVEANCAAVNAYGYSRKELLNLNIHDLSAKNTLFLVNKYMPKASKTGILFKSIHCKKDGSTFPVEVSSQSALIGEQEVVHLNIIRDISEREQAEQKIIESEAFNRSILNSLSAHIVVLDKDGNIKAVNEAWERLARENGIKSLNLIGKGVNYLEVCRRVDGKYAHIAQDALLGVQAVLEGTCPVYTLEYPYHAPQFKRWFLMLVTSLKNRNGGAVVTHIDITDRKLAEEEIRTAHKQFRDIIEFLPDATFVIDKDKKVIAWNKGMEKLTNTPKNNVIGKSCDLIAVSFYGRKSPLLIDCIFETQNLINQKKITKYYSNLKREGSAIYGETFVSGINKTLWVGATPLFDNEGKIIGAIESIHDITDRKIAEEKLRYITFHDTLTDVYSRAYFEKEMLRLENERFYPVGIIICDVDGLKLVNDTLGHNAGDKMLKIAARLIKKTFRNCDVVARIGGDEFAVLLPNSDEVAVESAYQRIKNELLIYNSTHESLPLSLSIGYAVSTNTLVNMDALYKEADDNMYREKLHCSQSTRSAIVHTLMKALEARDFITEGHAERLKVMVEELAKSIGLSERQTSDLRLLAQFHDIGKVGTPDRILFKNGPLSREEVIEMQRHCEIGYRIALSAPDLAPVADWILKHHERWDGSGYPLGIKGNEIPLECRILAIADAYDAMVSDRPYRKAMFHSDAIKEIKKCAGSQFDPILVEEFVNMLQQSEKTGFNIP